MGELLRIEKWAENLEEVTIGRWLKAEGQQVAAGEPVCEIITEKVTFEYESPLTGTLKKIYAPEKSVVPVGYVIGFIAAGDEEPPAGVEEQNRRLMETRQAQMALELNFEAPAARAGRRVRAVPAARRLARQHGVTVAEVAEALGIVGRPVSPEDVERYLAEHR